MTKPRFCPCRYGCVSPGEKDQNGDRRHRSVCRETRSAIITLLLRRPGTVATTSASLRYWNSARQRHCRPSERYQNIPASLPTQSPSHPRKPARKAGFSTFESGCGRETDCLLEGDGFEPSVPHKKTTLFGCP